MSPKIEKRKYGKISFPKDKIEEIKRIIAYRLTSAANVSEYCRMNLDTKIQSDMYRVEDFVDRLEQIKEETKELAEL